MKLPEPVIKALPKAVALIVFALTAMLYFAPQYQGRVLPMHDIQQYRGMSRDIVESQQQFGVDPHWTGAMFGGMPAYLISVKYDSAIIKRLTKVFEFLGSPAALLFIAMTGFFLMLVMWGVNPWISIAPSLAYGLSTYLLLIIGAGHITKMVALAYAPLMLGAIFYTVRRNIWVGAAYTAFFASIEIGANHPQITYYFLLVAAAFWINELVQALKGHFPASGRFLARLGQAIANAVKDKPFRHFAKATGLLLLAGALAVGSNLAPLWYVNLHSGDTIRGGSELASAEKGGGLAIDYATAWSYGRTESFNMFIPDLMGGASDGGFAPDGEVAGVLSRYNARGMATHLPGYWGDQPVTGGPTYIGAVIIFLAVMALMLVGRRDRWWIIAISVVALLLAWGRHLMWFTELAFDILPGYSKFRTVSMTLVILQWSLPFLAALGLGMLWNGEVDRKRAMKALRTAVCVAGGVALAFLVLGGTLFTFSGPSDAAMGLPDDILAAMHSERAAMLRGDSLRSLGLVLAAAALVWAFVAGKIKKAWLAVLLAGLVCLDLVPVDMRFLPQSKFVEAQSAEICPSEADRQILSDTTLGYRVANLTVSTFNDATTSYFHRSVGGYHGAKMRRYQDVIDRYLSKMYMPVYDMLDTKYFIVPDKQSGEPVAQVNDGAFGPAWFVSGVVTAGTPDAEIDAVGRIDLRTTAVVGGGFATMLPAGYETLPASDTLSHIALTEYRPNYLVYKYYSPAECVAVFSEIYYNKGWKSYVDGVETPHFCADYILRGMTLPAGEHTVEFRFDSPRFGQMSGLTFWFSAAIMLSVAAASVWKLFDERRRAKKDKEKRASESSK